MWTYDKVLEYPVNIKETNTELAKNIISQYGGPDGELAASLRYLSQRFGMPDQKSKAILNDIRNRRMSSLMLSIAKDSDLLTSYKSAIMLSVFFYILGKYARSV